ncbi:MAG TPA: aminotransferase class III-fold pyridoxal phosphate-dependent enzyme [Streptosporangiaceae bacterium]|nr:aminotransferase class III-fold pyridoxal phosphate-dependent enzyme [Streptosporangiaceae bacterium]
MPFDVARALAEHHGENFALHEKYMNRQLARVLKTLGFDRNYVRGEGCYLYDDQGSRYLDFLSGFGVYALGRSHPGVKAALHQALDLDLPNMVQMDCALLPGLLAKELVARAHPGIGRVFFCNSGAEADEAAIKFARASTGRPKILFAEHAFHGLTTGALALNGGKEFRSGFGELLPGTVPVRFGDLDALERQLRGGDVAAFIVEPIQGKGVFCASAEYWVAAQQLCRRHGTLLVMDEVQTGLGRTGRFFCHEHWGLQPDIITVSKALSGGYVPVGAMLTTEKVWASVYDSMQDALKHSTTFGRNQLAMVAGLATLAAFDEEGIVANAERTGAALQTALESMIDRYELVHGVRGMGLMIGIEFGEPESGSLRRRFRAVERLRSGMFSQMVVVPLFHRHRILTQVAADNVNVVKLLPPLISGQEEVDYFVEALDDVLADAHRGAGLAYEFGRTMARGALKGKSHAAAGGSVRARAGVTGAAAEETTAGADPARVATAGVAKAGMDPAGAGTWAEDLARRPAIAGMVGAVPAGRPATAVKLQPGDRVVITGASGFIGSAVARAAAARGAHVVAAIEPGADECNLKDIDAERAVVDVRDAAAVREVCEGARFVFHLAAIYRFWARDPRIFYDVNVGGTLNVLDAVAAAGCERLVYTSTVAVLGLAGTRRGTPADETCYADVAHLFGQYKRTKYVAEHEVLKAAGEGLDVCLALPTFPLGPGDLTPTPTGKVVLDFLNGKMPGFVNTAMNVCHVDDLAAGHLAALEYGRRGRSYILGGENLSMRTILATLADICGLPAPRLAIPSGLALAAGAASSLVEGKILRREPRVALEAARMATTRMIFNDERARAELRHTSRPAREAIEDSARWFTEIGYVSPARLAAITWQKERADALPGRD